MERTFIEHNENGILVLNDNGDHELLTDKLDIELFEKAKNGEFGEYIPPSESVLQLIADKELIDFTKNATNEAINSLTVEVDGLVFKANDKSISRMVAAISAAEQLGKVETTWKLDDGSTALITLSQLKTAQALAIQSVGQLIIN